MTQAGSVLGTPVYMSPEQARSVSDVDERSDLWSLAVITYECLLGKLPFDGPSLGEVFARIMFEPIPVPSAVDPTLPVAFDRWWQRAAIRDVEGRFASAREMAEALGEALGLGERRSSLSSKPDLASVHTVPPPVAGATRAAGASPSRWLVHACGSELTAERAPRSRSGLRGPRRPRSCTRWRMSASRLTAWARPRSRPPFLARPVTAMRRVPPPSPGPFAHAGAGPSVGALPVPSRRRTRRGARDATPSVASPFRCSGRPAGLPKIPARASQR